MCIYLMRIRFSLIFDPRFARKWDSTMCIYLMCVRFPLTFYDLSCYACESNMLFYLMCVRFGCAFHSITCVNLKFKNMHSSHAQKVTAVCCKRFPFNGLVAIRCFSVVFHWFSIVYHKNPLLKPLHLYVSVLWACFWLQNRSCTFAVQQPNSQNRLLTLLL